MNSFSKTSLDDILILVAEDDSDDCELFREVAGEADRHIRCEFVRNGEELLSRLKAVANETPQRLPDLIVLDVNMPRMNGKEALRRLKEDERLKSVPVVTLTTSNDQRLKNEMLELGSCAFYTKPHNLDKFKDVIAEMLVECLEPGFGS